jgi:D-glycero-D-manno-heptose 1,7-bisphosphate phosphatase
MMPDVAAPRRHALLDRDAPIMVESVYLTDPDAIEFSPGALDGLRMVRDAGFVFAMITNQSGVARRYFDANEIERIHHRVQPLVRAEGMRLEAIYFCPRGPEDQFDCRMPSSGRVYRTMRGLGFRPDDTVVIGESDADMHAADTAGVREVRVLSPGQCGHGATAPDFLEAARRACALPADRLSGEAACI